MKTKKRVLVIALIAALIAIISLGSLAWFTDSDEVTNKFTVEQNFGIDVIETDDQGNVVAEGDVKTGMTFENLMPGQKIHKDPTVNNTGDRPAYVRVQVTLTNGVKWMNIMAANGYDKVDLADFFGGFDPAKWTGNGAPVVGPAGLFSQEPIPCTWTFYLNEPLEAGQLATLFTDITIPGSLTVDQAKTLANGFDITIKADAIQSEFLPDTVKTAQDAFALLK